jgi:hypothetical protein
LHLLEPTWSANCIRKSSPFGRHFTLNATRFLIGYRGDHLQTMLGVTRAVLIGKSFPLAKESSPSMQLCSLVQRKYSPKADCVAERIIEMAWSGIMNQRQLVDDNLSNRSKPDCRSQRSRTAPTLLSPAN